MASPANPDFYKITWRDVESNVNAIQQKLDQMRWYPEFVIGVARGGLLPATMLSHRLKVPVSIISMATYDADETKKTNMAGAEGILYNPIDGSKMMWDEISCINLDTALLVDDICDTGETLEAISKHLPLVRIATLFQKIDPNARVPFSVPNWIHRGQVVPHYKWAVFPWE